MENNLEYQKGFGNYFQTEAIANTLIAGRNTPQKVPHGLYTEQLSGSAFTVARKDNLHTWLYKIYPSVLHGEFVLMENRHKFESMITPPNQLRWDPKPYPNASRDFIDSIFTLARNGTDRGLNGAAIHLYAATSSMQNKYFYNADGDFLIVPEAGGLLFKTELGLIDVSPGEIIVIPRGIKFQVLLTTPKARGYICENFGLPFRLPELGVIGASGLANPRDFEIPLANFEELKGNFSLICKFQDKFWQAEINHSPFNVVAWHGNYVPYKYDLSRFNTINTVSFDHPDPSIFTVLTSPSALAGVANVDFVIFPPRWVVANDTFRLPYFHRNIMSEYMGLISGTYDAKESGFVPGGGSLHNCMTAHGPDAEGCYQAMNSALQPEYYDNTLAFMFESSLIWQTTHEALTADFRQKNYQDCWQNLKVNFRSPAGIK